MPTIIDSLIVTLGIDAKGMDAKSRDSVGKLRDLEKQADKTEKGVEKIGSTSKTASSGLDTLARSATSLLAVLGGTLAIRRFIEDTINANAALDRFSKNIGVDVLTISAWGNAVEELGGSSRELQGVFDMLSKSQTELKLTGQSSLIPYFSALGVAIATVGGEARPVDEILLDLADRFSAMDRTTANNMGRMMGINQDTLNLLLQGRKEVELTVARQKDLTAVTKAQAEQASRQQRVLIDLKQNFAAFGRELLTNAAPALDKLLSLLTATGEWIRANSETVKVFLTIMAVGLGAIGLAVVPINLTVVAITALAAAIALLYQDYQVWKRGGDSFIDWEKWKPGIDLATAAIEKLQGLISTTWQKLKAMRDDPHTKWDTFEMLGLYKKKEETGNSGRIQKYFTDRGWTPEQAAGIAANLISESGGRTNATGDGGSAYGLAQWHPDRQKAFKNYSGKDIRNASFDEQLAFVQHELSDGNEQSAGKALRNAKTAQEAGAIVSRRYERPADADGEAQRRGSLAATLSGIKGASSTVASAGSSGGAPVTNIDRSVETHIGEMKIITSATDAAGIARDIGNAMDYTFVSQANAGLN